MNATREDGIEQVRLLKINPAFRNRRLSDVQLQHYSRLALEAFFAVAARWQLPPDDQATLLELAAGQLPAWRAQPGATTLSYAQLERVSYVLGIARNLAALMPDADADAWVRRPGPGALFNGQPPLALMKTGIPGLVKVHNYLYGPLF